MILVGYHFLHMTNNNKLKTLLQVFVAAIDYNDNCHARMRELLSYLHIPKTTSTCYMYEAIIVFKILRQFL